MKKILFSLLVVLTTGVLIANASQAVYSDQGEIAGNVIATGTLELTLNHSAGKPFSITNAYPGYVSGWEHMDIYNTGSLPFEANLTVSQTGGDAVLWDYARIEMKTAGWDSDCTNGDAGEKTIYYGLAKFFPAGLVASDIAYWHNANEDDLSGGPDNIRTGWSERVCQRVGVDNAAGNDTQNKSVTFTEIVNAVQDND